MSLFLSTFQKVIVEKASVTNSEKEALFYCSQCLKQKIRKYIFSYTLSDRFAREVKKILIQYYPPVSDYEVIVTIKG